MNTVDKINHVPILYHKKILIGEYLPDLLLLNQRILASLIIDRAEPPQPRSNT